MLDKEENETYLGVVTEMARFVDNSVNVSIYVEETPFIQIKQNPSSWNLHPGQSGLVDRFITVHVYFDQELASCDPDLFLIIGLQIVQITMNSEIPFSTECILYLDGDVSGWKTIRISAYSVCSIAGARNNAEIRVDFCYERNRPSLVLWDMSEGGLYMFKRKIVGIFSRDVIEVNVIII